VYAFHLAVPETAQASRHSHPADQQNVDLPACHRPMLNPLGHDKHFAGVEGIVLDGFELRTDVTRVRYPDRYQDPRGIRMWDQVMGLIAQRQNMPTIAKEAAA
jgi:hypothetical protein